MGKRQKTIPFPIPTATKNEMKPTNHKENIEQLKKNINLVGQKINLVPFTHKHLHDQNYLLWLQDYQAIRLLNLPDYLEKVPFEKVETYVQSMLASQNNIFCAIVTKEGKFIGTFRIGVIDWHAQNVNLGILIGDKNSWGKGIAQEAFSLALPYCFDTLRMHKIVGGCMQENIAMRKVFLNLGFKEEAFFRDQDFLEGKYQSHYHFGLLREEYEENFKTQKKL